MHWNSTDHPEGQKRVGKGRRLSCGSATTLRILRPESNNQQDRRMAQDFSSHAHPTDMNESADASHPNRSKTSWRKNGYT